MKKNEIEKLEREILRHAMQRLKVWKRENPQGLRPFGHPQAIVNKCGWNMIRALLKLEAVKRSPR